VKNFSDIATEAAKRPS